MGYRQLAAYDGKAARGMTIPFQMAGAPTSGAGGTFAAYAAVGSTLVDYTNGKEYICTAWSAGSPPTLTWVSVGSQT